MIHQKFGFWPGMLPLFPSFLIYIITTLADSSIPVSVIVSLLSFILSTQPQMFLRITQDSQGDYTPPESYHHPVYD